MPTALWSGLCLIMVASFILAGLELYRLSGRLPTQKQSAQLVVHTFEVITTAQMLFQQTQSALRSLRIYVNSRKPQDFETQQKNAHDALQLLASLKKLTADNPEQQRRMPVLETQMMGLLGELDRIGAVVGKGSLSLEHVWLQSNAPLDAMRNIGASIDATVNAERTVLTERLGLLATEEEQRSSLARWAAVLAFVILALGIMVVPIAFLRFRAAERAREESNRRLRLFVNGVQDYAIYALDVQGRVTDWNAGAERMEGYTADEIVGANFSRFYPDEDVKAGKPQQALETAAKQGAFQEEAWRIRKDRSRFLADVAINAIRDSGGRLVGYMKITRDIEDLRNKEQALAQYAKMDALGQLTGGIAHDFNNLLHVIKNGVELAESRLKKPSDEVGGYLEIVKRNVDRAASLTQRLLAFARRQPLDPRPINPDALIGEITALLAQVLGESISIESVMGAGVWWISADASQLETAILNLALNARDAMPSGGKLTVEISNAFLDEDYASSHSDLKVGQYVMIAVSDTGHGMPSEVAAKAFDPFFTTKEAGAGTGLGLSQVYGFIKQSGGHAKIYSEVGYGTTVKLYLPRLARPVNSNALREPEALQQRAGKEQILLVEDDNDVRRFTAEVLRDMGYQVLEAAHAAEALDILSKQASVAMLFTDVGLPGGMNGRALADEALKRRADLRVLYMTGYARNAIVHHGRLDDGVALITKPFTRFSVAEKVRELLDH